MFVDKPKPISERLELGNAPNREDTERSPKFHTWQALKPPEWDR